MTFKPKKSRALVIKKVIVAQHIRLTVQEDAIPSIVGTQSSA